MMTDILVIEDDVNIRESLVELLSVKNYRPTFAENGQKGIEMALKSRPDLILCDIMMPGKSGYDVLEELRSKKGFSTIPFIFLTAKSQKSDVRNGMNLGADDYLTKPFQAAELFSAIESRLERKAAEHKEKIDAIRPYDYNILNTNIFNPIQGILESSGLLEKQLESYSPQELRQFLKRMHNTLHKLDRSIRNIILYQSVQLSVHDLAMVKSMTNGKAVSDERYIKNLTAKVALGHNREADIFIRNVEKAVVPIAQNIVDCIIQEVVINAFQYSKQGQLVSITAHIYSGYYYIEVQDLGAGIKKERLERLGQSPVESYRGMGLGLYLVCELLKMSGGEMKIDSTYKSGTKVTLKFKTAR